MTPASSTIAIVKDSRSTDHSTETGNITFLFATQTVVSFRVSSSRRARLFLILWFDEFTNIATGVQWNDTRLVGYIVYFIYPTWPFVLTSQTGLFPAPCHLSPSSLSKKIREECPRVFSGVTISEFFYLGEVK